MYWRIRLSSAKVGVLVEVEAELGNKLGLSCAKLRLASQLSLLLLLNPKLCKFEKQSTSTEVNKVK